MTSLLLSVCLSLSHQVFTGNQEAYETKINTFFPPVIGRFIRLHPINWYNKATVRMEFYGCELDGKMLLYVCVVVLMPQRKSMKISSTSNPHIPYINLQNMQNPLLHTCLWFSVYSGKMSVNNSLEPHGQYSFHTFTSHVTLLCIYTVSFLEEQCISPIDSNLVLI